MGDGAKQWSSLAYNTIPWTSVTGRPSSMKNPNALTISLNGASQGAYDGSAAKTVNITPASIGAAAAAHSHDPHDRVLTCTIPVSGWSAAAPYTQTVSLSGITASDNPVAALLVPDNATATTLKPAQKAWSCVDQILTNNGSITLYCYFKKPANEFQITLKGQ